MSICLQAIQYRFKLQDTTAFPDLEIRESACVDDVRAITTSILEKKSQSAFIVGSNTLVFTVDRLENWALKMLSGD